ncbi:outer membrane beta-barrel protein [Ekhidna sp.]
METKKMILSGIFTRKFSVSVLSLIVYFISHTSLAQDVWSVEVRPGVNVATKDLGDADLNTGFGFEGTFSYRFMPHLSAYAGWSWNKFKSDESFAGTDMDFEETGYTFGLQFIHPIGASDLDFIVRAGALYNHIEVEDDDGELISDSDHGFGWQAGGGIVFSLSERWRLIPTVRYRSLSRDLTIGNTETEVDLNYVSFGIGASLNF